jgi:tetratricopeptide (TPR) repeat protein
MSPHGDGRYIRADVEKHREVCLKCGSFIFILTRQGRPQLLLCGKEGREEAGSSRPISVLTREATAWTGILNYSTAGNNMTIHFASTIALSVMMVSRVAGAEPEIVKGDSAFARLDYDTAARAYDSLQRSNAGGVGVYWRIARLHIAMGDIVEGNERQEHYQKAVESARAGVALDSSSSDAYAWLAASLGSIAMDAGSRRKVALANEIKHALDFAVTLNPRNDVAWSILGTFYRSLGGITWFERQIARLLLGSLPEGGYVESEEAFRRAISIAPRIVRHHFELALLYAQTDRPVEAAAEYAACLRLPPQMASDLRREQEARTWLNEHQSQVDLVR